MQKSDIKCLNCGDALVLGVWDFIPGVASAGRYACRSCGYLHIAPWHITFLALAVLLLVLLAGLFLFDSGLGYFDAFLATALGFIGFAAVMAVHLRFSKRPFVRRVK